MGPPPRSVVRIAHAYGNNRDSLTNALHADIDMIEADMWYRGGDLHIHHEHRLRWLPILVDLRMPTHKPGRFAIPVGKYFVRPAIGSLRLKTLLEATAGRKRLLLDVKGHYKPDDLEGYVRRLVRLIREYNAESWTVVCGQTYSILHRLREVAPDIEVRYSIERPYQWQRFERLMAHGARRVCIWHRFLDDVKTRALQDAGVDVYCWTVDDPDTANHLVELGADGIISNDLTLLAGLPRSEAATS
jgi:glycerophosphoryl diester phosphodiesterase